MICSLQFNAMEIVVVTKREILSQNLSIFDPLSLCLLVTVKGRLFSAIPGNWILINVYLRTLLEFNVLTRDRSK